VKSSWIFVVGFIENKILWVFIKKHIEFEIFVDFHLGSNGDEFFLGLWNLTCAILMFV